MSTAVFAVTPSLAEIVTFVGEVTPDVDTVKGAEVWPCATTTLAGTVVREVFAEVRVTVRPPVGAGPLSVRVPVEVPPPTTDVGLSVSCESVTFVTVTAVVWLLAPRVAVSVTLVEAATPKVVAVKAAEVWP